MECRWGGCKETLDEKKEFIEHVNKHAQEGENKKCHWQSCTKLEGKKVSRCTLLAHIRIHTREKPFRCKLCSKEYSRSDALNKHMKSHEQIAADENIYIKKFSYLSLLEQEAEIRLKDKQQEYKRLMVENDLLLNYLCKDIQRKRK